MDKKQVIFIISVVIVILGTFFIGGFMACSGQGDYINFKCMNIEVTQACMQDGKIYTNYSLDLEQLETLS